MRGFDKGSVWFGVRGYFVTVQVVSCQTSEPALTETVFIKSDRFDMASAVRQGGRRAASTFAQALKKRIEESGP